MGKLIIILFLQFTLAAISQTVEKRCGLDPLQNGSTESLVRPELSGPVLKIETDNFIVHYTLSGDDETNYDYALDISNAAEHSYNIQCGTDPGELNWMAPPSDDMRGGDNRYDIYIMDLTYEGITIREIPPGWNNNWAASYIKVHNLLPDIEIQQVVVAHEFNHACQFAYSYIEYNTGNWFYENCAVWIEKLVYPGLDNYLEFLEPTVDNPINNTERGISYIFGVYKYGGFLWPLFLSEWKSDNDIIRKIWERLEENQGYEIIPDIDYILSNQYNSNIDEAYLYYSTWRWFTGSRATTGSYFSIASLIALEATPDRNISSYPYSTTDPGQTPGQVFGNGGCQYNFFQGSPEIINIIFNGPNAPPNFAANTLRDLSPSEPSISEPISLTNNDGNKNIQLTECNGVVLIPVNLSSVGLTNYHFSAEVVTDKRVVKFENRYLTDNLGGFLLLDDAGPQIPSGSTRL